MNKPEISIIVPVYNASRFLDDCIMSVRNQTYEGWELLLVNDGSKDNSLTICKRHEMEDSRVRVFDIPNQGACVARNIGLDNARGNFIVFLDADDRYDSNFLKRTSQLQSESGADVVCAESCPIDASNNVLRSKQCEYEFLTMDNEELLKGMYDKKYMLAIWSKLYRKDYIGSQRFPDKLALGQDVYFNTALLHKRKGKVVLTGERLHQYRMLEDSLSHSKDKGLLKKNNFINHIIRLWETEISKSDYKNKEIIALNILGVIRSYYIMQSFGHKEKKQDYTHFIKNVVEYLHNEKDIQNAMNMIKMNDTKFNFYFSYLQAKKYVREMIYNVLVKAISVPLKLGRVKN